MKNSTQVFLKLAAIAFLFTLFTVPKSVFAQTSEVQSCLNENGEVVNTIDGCVFLQAFKAGDVELCKESTDYWFCKKLFDDYFSKDIQQKVSIDLSNFEESIRNLSIDLVIMRSAQGLLPHGNLCFLSLNTQQCADDLGKATSQPLHCHEVIFDENTTPSECIVNTFKQWNLQQYEVSYLECNTNYASDLCFMESVILPSGNSQLCLLIENYELHIDCLAHFKLLDRQTCNRFSNFAYDYCIKFTGSAEEVALSCAKDGSSSICRRSVPFTPDWWVYYISNNIVFVYLFFAVLVACIFRPTPLILKYTDSSKKTLIDTILSFINPLITFCLAATTVLVIYLIDSMFKSAEYWNHASLDSDGVNVIIYILFAYLFFPILFFFLQRKKNIRSAKNSLRTLLLIGPVYMLYTFSVMNIIFPSVGYGAVLFLFYGTLLLSIFYPLIIAKQYTLILSTHMQDSVNAKYKSWHRALVKISIPLAIIILFLSWRLVGSV